MSTKYTPNTAPRPERIMQLSGAFQSSCVLFAAADAGIFTQLHRLKAADSSTLAAACGLSPHGARLLLDACVAIGLLEKSPIDGRYRNTPESDAFLVAGAPADLSRAIRYHRDVYDAWGRLGEFSRTGKPVERPERHLGEDPARTRRFVMAMHARALAIGRAVVPRIPLDGVHHLLDIGGGSGAYAILLAQRYPELRCTLIDLPAVAAIARECVAEAGLGDRIQCLDGDYHSTPLPADADAAMLFGMLHQEAPAAIQHLLSRVFDALRPGSQLFVLDMMTDATRCHPPFSALFAVNMALTTETGWVFSDRELRDWMLHAGFRDFSCAPLPPPMPHWLASARTPAV